MQIRNNPGRAISETGPIKRLKRFWGNDSGKDVTCNINCSISKAVDHNYFTRKDMEFGGQVIRVLTSVLPLISCSTLASQ